MPGCIILPGDADTTNLYHGRVSARDGITAGSYELNIRLRELVEVAGSNILYAESENTSLLRLYKDVSNELELSSSHRFTPHVTLMRIKKIVDRQTFFERLEHYRNQPLGRLQNRAALYSSELHRGGARYTLLKEWRS